MSSDTSTATRRELLRRGTAGATALVLGGTALSGNAGAQDESQHRIDLAGLTLLNPCNGEVVDVTRGTLHVRQRVRPSDDDPYGSRLAVNTSGVQGVGRETDARYVVTSTLSNVAESSPAGGLSNALEARVLVVSQGPTDNFLARLLLSLDVDEGGRTWTVGFEPVSKCRG